MALVGIENQATVDFIGTDDQVIFFSENGEIRQFLTTPATTDRIMGMAKQEKPGFCRT